MGEKRYYWLKLHKDFFKSKELKKLRSIAGGDTYTIIYLKLQLLSLENDGSLFFEGIDDTFASELALDIDEGKDNVQVTLELLLKMGLLEHVSKEEVSIPLVLQNIGSETPSANRKRISRASKEPVDSGYSEEFESFWKHYKVGNKKLSFKKWQKLTIKQKDEIRVALPAYLKATPNGEFRKHGQTYLNKEAEYWKDSLQKEIETSDPSRGEWGF